MFFVLLLHNVTLVTAVNLKLAGALMALEIALEHLSLTPVVSALNRSEVALLLMRGEVFIGDIGSATLIRVRTGGPDDGKLPLKERVWIDETESGRAALGAAHNAVILDAIVNVVVDAHAAIALSTLVAFTWINHHVGADETGEEGAILGCWRIFRRDDLVLLDRKFALHDERSACSGSSLSVLFGDELDPSRGILFKGVLPGRVLVVVLICPETILVVV